VLRFLTTAALTAIPLACSGSRADSASPRAPIELFSYDRKAALDVRTVSIEAPDSGLLLERMSFRSPGGDRVTGVIARPAAPGTYAGIVLMHGLPGEAESALRHAGLGIAAAGAVVISIDAPWSRRGDLPDLTPRDSADQVQLMQDLQRAVDVLEARADVDPTRIGYVGGSYGGAMGVLFTSIERRLKAAVLFVPDGGLVSHFTDSLGNPLSLLANATPAARRRWLAAMWPIEPIRFLPDAPMTQLLIQNGVSDALVTTEDAYALHLAIKGPKVIQWYPAGHGLNAKAQADRLAFLTEHLRLSPTTR
jgi:uncharacterized protein